MTKNKILLLTLPVLCLLALTNAFCNDYKVLENKTPYLIETDGQLVRFLANIDDHKSLIINGLIEGEIYEVYVNALPNQQNVYLDAINSVLKSPQESPYKFTAQKVNYFQFSSEGSICLAEFYVSVLPIHTNNQIPTKSMGVLEVDASVTNESLVENLLLGCGTFDVSSVTFNTDSNSRGMFSNGSTNIGIDGGLILSTGNISVAASSNTQTGASSISSGGTDIDLSLLVGVSTNDAAVLEFDFVPQTSMIRFKYVFASEEYCEYTNSPYNDGFGFFISGPGINGPYSNNAINIATLPNGAFVSINNVNHFNNSEYYISNTTPSSNSGVNCGSNHPLGSAPAINEVEFDAFTTVLVAETAVQPFETYHIKLAIADALDNIFDSAIFIEQYSFNDGTECLMLEVPETSGQPNTEICVPLKVNLFDSILSTQFSVNYDASLLSYTEAKNLNLENLSLSNINNPSSGDITVSWLSPDNINGTTVPDQTTICDLCFDAIGQEGEVTELSLSNSPLPISLSNSAGSNLNLDGNIGAISLTGDVLCDNDVEDPEFTSCPQDIVFNLALGACETIVQYAIEAEDNCQVDSLVLLTGPNSGSIIGYGTSAVTWEAVDEAGNTTQCTFNVVVNASEIIPDTLGLCPADVISWECYPAISEPGYYECVYTSSLGCDSTVALHLEELKVPFPITNIETICESDCPYIWNGQEYCDEGVFTHVYTVFGGCEVTDTLFLTLDSPIDTQLNVEACDSFYWELTEQFYYESGVYTEVLSSNLCDSSYTLDLTVNTISDLSLTVESGTISTTNTSATYQWLDCNNGYEPIPGANDQSFTPVEAGDYALELVIGSCTEITECVNVIPTSIVELGNKQLEIYPNPTNGMIEIDFGKTSTGLLRVYDLQGRQIYSQFVEEAEHVSRQLGTQAGLYLVEFVDEAGEVFLGKVLKVD